MRKYQNFTALLCSLFICMYSIAQQPLSQINISFFSIKNRLPSNVTSWGTTPGGMILTAQRIPQTPIQGIRLVVQIKQAAGKICGNSLDASPMLDFKAVKTFSASELSGYLSNCATLKPGNYSMCVQFFNVDRYPISKEVCKEFVVEDAAQIQQNYGTVQNIFPTNKKQFKIEEIKLPITFRWTPIIPKPKENITYRLKVWQLMKGQSGVAAMRINEPLLIKEVQNTTQAIVSNIYTEPCKLPYLCDFVWVVQTLNKEGKIVGTSEYSSFVFPVKLY